MHSGVVLGNLVSGFLEDFGWPVVARVIAPPELAGALDLGQWVLERGSAWLHSAKRLRPGGNAEPASVSGCCSRSAC